MRVSSIGTRELNFNAAPLKGGLYIIGAQYEINGLTPGQTYFARVSAENTPGVCTSDMKFVDECGSFAATVPESVVVKKAPDAPTSVVAKVVDAKSVEVKWLEPSSFGTVSAYRVDCFTRSSAATSYSSFFGDSEVQEISIDAPSNVGSGTFTLAFPEFVELPGTVSGIVGTSTLKTSENLSSHFEDGDYVKVALPFTALLPSNRHIRSFT